MAVQTIFDGPRNVIVKITADGTESGTAIDVSALNPPCTRVNITRIWFSNLDAEASTLSWDATTDLLIAKLHGQQDFNFEGFGGLVNNAGAGVTGDVLYSLPAGGGTIVLHCKKHNVIIPL